MFERKGVVLRVRAGSKEEGDETEEVGVSEGEEISIVTATGTACFRAKLTDSIHPLTVSIAHGWPGAQNGNSPVDDLAMDPLAATPPYRDMCCRVENL